MHKLLLTSWALLLYTESALCLWEYAVTTNSRIIFYNAHWQEIISSAYQFKQLSALTFDDTEEIIYFSDQLHNNGSIFSLRIPTDMEEPHIIERIVQRTQNETITSIAYDPLNRNLFWADFYNRKICFIPTDDAETVQQQVLIDFSSEDSVPDGIAIDICRRKLYWTNSNFKNASVERSDLNGNNREIIVNNDLYLPHGIIIDHISDRIYWVVDQEGMHFSIETANLDGSDRHVIVRGLNNIPFSLTVTKDIVFWTDLIHNAIWSHSKFANAEILESPPHKVLNFAEQPRGIVLRSRFLTVLQNDNQCSVVVRKIKDLLVKPRPVLHPIDLEITKLRSEFCLNGAEYIEQNGMCICKIGYNGARCEIDECHNHCVHGTCTMSLMGFPKCSCQKGFYGERCQSYKCTRYCFNNGLCKIENSGDPVCECSENFGGQRCEQNSTEICSLFCRVLKNEPDTYVPYGCHDICEQLSQQNKEGTEVYAVPQYKHLEVCQSTITWSSTVIVVIVFGVLMSLCFVLLIVHALRRFYKPVRPRIKKTFVVRKQEATTSNTPLTNRPVTAEQCEITIENCCNMNICDTPCFDSKLVQQSILREADSRDDKTMLIQNMEDELY